jgi:hypothetical protein
MARSAPSWYGFCRDEVWGAKTGRRDCQHIDGHVPFPFSFLIHLTHSPTEHQITER